MNILSCFILDHEPFSFLLVTETQDDVFLEILQGELDFSFDPWPSISTSAKDLIKKMLVRDRCWRLTAHEILCKFNSFSFSPCKVFEKNVVFQYSVFLLS